MKTDQETIDMLEQQIGSLAEEMVKLTTQISEAVVQIQTLRTDLMCVGLSVNMLIHAEQQRRQLSLSSMHMSLLPFPT